MAINKSKVGRRVSKLLPIPVKEWEGIVYVKKIQFGEMDKIKSIKDDDIKQVIVALIIGLTDEDGETPIFTENDFDFLLKEEMALISNIFNKIIEFNTVDYDKKKEN